MHTTDNQTMLDKLTFSWRYETVWRLAGSAKKAGSIIYVLCECLLHVLHQNPAPWRAGGQVLADTDCAPILPHDRHIPHALVRLPPRELLQLNSILFVSNHHYRAHLEPMSEIDGSNSHQLVVYSSISSCRVKYVPIEKEMYQFPL